MLEAPYQYCNSLNLLKNFYGIENATCLKPFGKEAEAFIDLCMPQIHTRITGDSNSILRLNLTYLHR